MIKKTAISALIICIMLIACGRSDTSSVPTATPVPSVTGISESDAQAMIDAALAEYQKAHAEAQAEMIAEMVKAAIPRPSPTPEPKKGFTGLLGAEITITAGEERAQELVDAFGCQWITDEIREIVSFFGLDWVASSLAISMRLLAYQRGISDGLAITYISEADAHQAILICSEQGFK